VTENAGEPVVDDPSVDGRSVRSRIRFGSSRKDVQALTTIGIRQRRSSLSFALALHDTCADARWANVGALAGLEDVVVLALSDWNRHASVAGSVCGFSDLVRRCVLELELVGIGLLPFQPVEHLEARRFLVVGCVAVNQRPLRPAARAKWYPKARVESDVFQVG
jgi:hypothetical protein